MHGEDSFAQDDGLLQAPAPCRGPDVYCNCPCYTIDGEGKKGTVFTRIAKNRELFSAGVWHSLRSRSICSGEKDEVPMHRAGHIPGFPPVTDRLQRARKIFQKPLDR